MPFFAQLSFADPEAATNHVPGPKEKIKKLRLIPEPKNR